MKGVMFEGGRRGEEEVLVVAVVTVVVVVVGKEEQEDGVSAMFKCIFVSYAEDAMATAVSR